MGQKSIRLQSVLVRVKIKRMDYHDQTIFPMLQREYLFSGLTPGQLARVLTYFQRVPFERDHVIFSEGDEADSFYIILNGTVRLTTTGRDGKEKLINVLGPGDFFGEQALLFNRPRSAAGTTVDHVEVLRLDQQSFPLLMQEFPQIRMNLSATAESRRLARKARLNWLSPDEVIYYMTRKHDIFLFLALILPIIIFVASLPTLAFAYYEVDNNFLFNSLMIAGTLMFLGGFLWGAWSWLDWSNDYYIVSNQRVIWVEKVAGLYDSRREAPLDTVLAVNVFSGQIGRIIGYGTVNVRTFTGGMTMHRMNKPDQFAGFVEGYRQRVIANTQQEEAKLMESALEQALLKSKNVVKYEIPPETPSAPPPSVGPGAKRKQKGGMGRTLDNFLKVRYEQNGMVTYRKHWFLLLRRAWLPLIGLILIMMGNIFLVWAQYMRGYTPPWLFALGLSFLAALVLFLWLGYDYADWRNDIYRLTPEQILDIERKPLGKELKKTANLDSILSIEHERAGIFGILLNFGNVFINVGTTRFTFHGVYNPDQVHSDVSDYREALNRRKRMSEVKREQDRMVNWLVTFYNESEKLTDLENQDQQE